ncbi:MAG: hypothetical protein QOK36_4322 [Gaiellales bacterium]|nr:hypothetical protein [Gaiellales bacterium]
MGQLARICAVAATAVAVDPAEGLASPTFDSPTTRLRRKRIAGRVAMSRKSIVTAGDSG